MTKELPDTPFAPNRATLIETRYRQILDCFTRGEPSLVEELGPETLRRLCVFSNTALVSAYVTRPDDPTLQEMEVLHDALSDEYSDRADAENLGMLPQNVHVFPGTDISEVVTEGEPIEACPAMTIEYLRYLAKNALRG